MKTFFPVNEEERKKERRKKTPERKPNRNVSALIDPKQEEVP